MMTLDWDGVAASVPLCGGWFWAAWGWMGKPE
jgi:hypothetical protein